MKNKSTIVRKMIFAVAFVALLVVSASANSADQSIWFQGQNTIQEIAMGSPTCSFSDSAGQSIWFPNPVMPQKQDMGSVLLCNVSHAPGQSIWTMAD